MAEHKWIGTQIYFFVDKFEAPVEPVVQIADRVEDNFCPIISPQVPFQWLPTTRCYRRQRNSAPKKLLLDIHRYPQP